VLEIVKREAKEGGKKRKWNREEMRGDTKRVNGNKIRNDLSEIFLLL